MRQIIVDTETTGLSPAEGHRIIEIAGLEMVKRKLTGREFHYYLQPDREIDWAAAEVHGITPEKLAGQPRFGEVAEEFIEFVRDAELIIHNAPFDVGFINAELRRLNGRFDKLEHYCRVLDTLTLARTLHPGQKNGLDALCKRYSVDNSGRELHGALLDTQLLAEVYLAMTGGQTALSLEQQGMTGLAGHSLEPRQIDPNRPRLAVIAPTSDELEAHHKRLQAIQKSSGGQCLWLSLEATG